MTTEPICESCGKISEVMHFTADDVLLCNSCCEDLQQEAVEKNIEAYKKEHSDMADAIYEHGRFHDAHNKWCDALDEIKALHNTLNAIELLASNEQMYVKTITNRAILEEVKKARKE